MPDYISEQPPSQVKKLKLKKIIPNEAYLKNLIVKNTKFFTGCRITEDGRMSYSSKLDIFMLIMNISSYLTVAEFKTLLFIYSRTVYKGIESGSISYEGMVQGIIELDDGDNPILLPCKAGYSSRRLKAAVKSLKEKELISSYIGKVRHGNKTRDTIYKIDLTNLECMSKNLTKQNTDSRPKEVKRLREIRKNYRNKGEQS